MHSTHQPSSSQSVLVRSSLCIPPTGNPSLQSVRVCPTSASATTVHCVFHLPQSELVLSISIPVNENHLCSPHNRQPDRNQCLWIPWCAFHYVLLFCSFCLLAITPMQSVPVCSTGARNCSAYPSGILLNFLPLGNQLIRIILFVQLSSHCLRIQLPHAQMAFAAQHVLGHRSPPRHSRATDFPLPSCTFSARHLWVTMIFGRGFQVVFLHFAALLLQSLQHQSSLLLNFLPLGNQLIHIILFVQLSSHCLRIQLSHPQRAFTAHHVLGHRSPPRHSRATVYSLPSCTFSARHLWVTVIFGRGFQVVFLHFAALLLQSLQHQSSLLLNFLPLGNQLIHIILFVQLSSHCLRIQLPHPQRAFSAQHVLGHRSPPRHSRATDFPLPSCTFSARHLWVTVIFGRGFQVVFLHFAALLLQSLPHQSSLLLNLLPLGNQLIHIILFVQLSSHCLRIQLSHPQRAFAAHHVLGHRSPLRHSRATDFPLPSCTFSARHLWVTVIFGRGFQVVFLHFAALLLQSLQHQSSLLLNFLPLGNQLIHIILFVQLSSHCLRIQLPHPQMAFAAHIRPSCSWPPLSSSPQPRH